MEKIKWPELFEFPSPKGDSYGSGWNACHDAFMSLINFQLKEYENSIVEGKNSYSGKRDSPTPPVEIEKYYCVVCGNGPNKPEKSMHGYIWQQERCNKNREDFYKNKHMDTSSDRDEEIEKLAGILCDYKDTNDCRYHNDCIERAKSVIKAGYSLGPKTEMVALDEKELTKFIFEEICHATGLGMGYCQTIAKAICAKFALPRSVPDKNDILGAVAQGWCTNKNAKKCMDADLAMDIAESVFSLLRSSERSGITVEDIRDDLAKYLNLNGTYITTRTDIAQSIKALLESKRIA